MSRPIAESVSLLSETLMNCKTNLTEKKVADVDNIKISDVDEKIAEIQAGGGETQDGVPKYFSISPTSFEEEMGLGGKTFKITISEEQKALFEKNYPYCNGTFRVKCDTDVNVNWAEFGYEDTDLYFSSGNSSRSFVIVLLTDYYTDGTEHFIEAFSPSIEHSSY